MKYTAYSFGPLSKSLKEQGYPLTDTQHKVVERMLEGLYAMMIRRIVTDKEYDRILDRLWKQCEKWRSKNEVKP